MRLVLDIPDESVHVDGQVYRNVLEQQLKDMLGLTHLELYLKDDYGINLDALVSLTREYVGTDELEVDPLHPGDVSPGEDGIWVRAWVFLDNEYLAEHGIHNPEGVYEDEEQDEQA